MALECGLVLAGGAVMGMVALLLELATRGQGLDALGVYLLGIGGALVFVVAAGSVGLLVALRHLGVPRPGPLMAVSIPVLVVLPGALGSLLPVLSVPAVPLAAGVAFALVNPPGAGGPAGRLAVAAGLVVVLAAVAVALPVVERARDRRYLTDSYSKLGFQLLAPVPPPGFVLDAAEARTFAGAYLELTYRNPPLSEAAGPAGERLALIDHATRTRTLVLAEFAAHAGHRPPVTCSVRPGPTPRLQPCPQVATLPAGQPVHRWLSAEGKGVALAVQVGGTVVVATQPNDLRLPEAEVIGVLSTLRPVTPTQLARLRRP